MTWQDRHYHRDEPHHPIADRFSGASMVMWLLGINGLTFLIDSILSGSSRGGWISPSEWGHFSVAKGIFGLQIWRWITYQFLHYDFFHLLFNMIGLYFFGPLIERWWGSRRFLAFYLLCGLGAAGVYTLLSLVPGLLNVSSSTGLVGASGCIFGVLVGCAMLYPNQQVMLLIPPIPMKMKTMAMFFLGLALLSLVAGSPNAGGEAAHLGGAVMGWVLIHRAHWLDVADRLSPQRVHDALESSRHRNQAREEAQVDRILDKVRNKGLASLTSREKKILQRATNRHRSAG